MFRKTNVSTIINELSFATEADGSDLASVIKAFSKLPLLAAKTPFKG